MINKNYFIKNKVEKRKFYDDNFHYEKFAGGRIEKVEVPHEIPDSWEWVRFVNVVDYYMGKTPTRTATQFWGNNFPWVSISDMPESGLLKETKEMISKEALDKLFSEKISPVGTLIMSFKLTVGRVSILDIKAVHNEAIISIFPYCDENNKIRNYLFACLPSIANSGDIKGAIKGKTLNSTSINNLLIPFPPINEQYRIVQKLKLIFNYYEIYNKLYEKLQKLNQEFPEKLRQSILQYAMQGKLVKQDPNDDSVDELLEQIRAEKKRLYKKGKIKKKDLEENIICQGDDNSYYENIPVGWRLVSLNTIGKVISGGTPKSTEKSYYNGDIPWITPADMGGQQKDVYLNKHKKNITRLGLENSSAQLIPKNSIVFSSRAPIGYINIVPYEYTTNQGCKSISPYHIHLKWLYYALSEAKNRIEKNASGTTFLEISLSKLSETEILLPPLAEQKKIASQVDLIFEEFSRFFE